MRVPVFDGKAPKKTIGVTLNADLYAKTKAIGINTSAVAEEALAVACARRLRVALADEVAQDLAAVHEYAEQHGSFADYVRRNHEAEDVI